MVFLATLSASALLLVGEHAELHPANPNLYMELPEVHRAIEAYPQARTLQLLHDSSVTRLVAGLMGEDPEGFDMDAQLEGFFDDVVQSMPELQLVSALMGDARSASLSVSGMNIDQLGGKLARSEFSLTPDVLEQLNGTQLRLVLGYEGAPEEEIARALASLTSLMEVSLGEARTQAGELQGHSVELSVWSGEALLGNEVLLTRRGTELLIGVGSEAAGHLLSGGAALAADPDFKGLGSDFAEPNGVVLYDLYVNATDASELSEMVGEMDPELAMVSGALGLATGVAVPGDHFQERWRTRLLNGRFLAETSSIDHGRDVGVQPLLGVAPVKAEAFGLVPADAVAVWATTLNKEGIADLLIRALSQGVAGDSADVLAEIEATYDMNPQAELIDPMGESLVFYAMPFSGIGAPKMFVALELNDPAAFAAGMERLGAVAVNLSGGALEFTSKPYRKNPFMSFSPASDELASGGAGDFGSVGIAGSVISSLASGLAIGVVDGRAVLSLSNIYTKREMRRLIQGEGEPHALAAANLSLPEDTTSYGVTDWGGILDSLYSSLRGMLPLLQGSVGDSLPFSMEDLPPEGIFSRYMKPTVSWSKRTERGYYSYSDASFGPEVLGLLSGGVTMLFFTRQESTSEIGGPIVYAEEQPIELEPGGGDEAEKTRVILSGVKVGIVLFKASVGRYPQNLEELTHDQPDFPDGFLGSQEVPLDAWSHALGYELSEDGNSYRLWSWGPNGLDEQGGGDDQSLPAKKPR